jgi:hypothetical protein
VETPGRFSFSEGENFFRILSGEKIMAKKSAFAFPMKALKTFMDVTSGAEFDAGSQARATELENKGLAVPLSGVSRKTKPNRAAVDGPKSSAGGLGDGASVSLSRPGRAPAPARRSSRAPSKRAGK